MKNIILFLVVNLLFLGACKGPGGSRDVCGVWLIDMEPAAKRESAKMLPILKACLNGADRKTKKEISEHIREIKKKGVPYRNLWFVVKDNHTWAMYYGDSGKIKAIGKWSSSGGELFLFFKKKLRANSRLDSFFPYEDLGCEKGKESREAVSLVCKGFVFSLKGKGLWVANYMYQIKGKRVGSSGEFPKKGIPVIRVFP